MKRMPMLLAVAAAALLPVPAQATITILNADLSGSQEVPPAATGGTGFGIVTVDDVLNTLRVQVFFSGLTGNTVASHIHCCAPLGTNAGVATELPSFTGFPLGVTSGTYDNTFNLNSLATYNPAFVTANGGSLEGARSAFLTGLTGGLSYLNIHSTVFPRGEIRGQLTAVPEPGSWMLMLTGFGLAGLTLRRRRRDIPALA